MGQYAIIAFYFFALWAQLRLRHWRRVEKRVRNNHNMATSLGKAIKPRPPRCWFC